MPTLRSQGTKSTSEKTTTMVAKKVIAEQSHWVLVAPKTLMEDEDEAVFNKMPHPQNGAENVFLFKNGKVFQLMKCEDECRSWFVDNFVIREGAPMMVTPIDPLFLALPYIEKSSATGKFVPLDNILVDQKYQSAMTELEKCLDKRSLENVCQCRGSEDFAAYRADETKILSWLTLKVKTLSAHLMKTDIHVDLSSSRAKCLVREKIESECTKYAWDIISDYLTTAWSHKLKDQLGIKDDAIAVVPDAKPAVKKQKLNDSTAVERTSTGEVEDYRDHKKEKEASKPKSKISAGHKALQKVDKKGMKTMSSFFTSKPKK